MPLAIEDLWPEVTRAARTGHRGWGAVYSVDDLEQGIWAALLESPVSLRAILGSGEQDRARVLRYITRRVAGQENAAYEHFTGNQYYSTGDVRRILARGGAGDIPGCSSHVEWMDVQAGMETLGVTHPRYAEILFSNYVAGDYDTSRGAARMELTRAVDALCGAMNTRRGNAVAVYEGPGSRTVTPEAAGAGAGHG